MSEKPSINITVSGDQNGMINLGKISGSVTNTINQLPASPDPNISGIKELLAQLQKAIEAESELSEKNKTLALEQVKTLAEAGQKPQDNDLQTKAQASVFTFKGIVSSLPDATKLAEACVKLLPMIVKLLGF